MSTKTMNGKATPDPLKAVYGVAKVVNRICHDAASRQITQIYAYRLVAIALASPDDARSAEQVVIDWMKVEVGSIILEDTGTEADGAYKVDDVESVKPIFKIALGLIEPEPEVVEEALGLDEPIEDFSLSLTK